MSQVLSGLEGWHIGNNDSQKENHFIWWCFMCNNQYRLKSKIESSETLSRVFGERLVTVGKMLIMLDTIEFRLTSRGVGACSKCGRWCT